MKKKNFFISIFKISKKIKDFDQTNKRIFARPSNSYPQPKQHKLIYWIVNGEQLIIPQYCNKFSFN